MANRTEDASTVLATSKHRQRVREETETREESTPLVGPDNPLLTLEWPERSGTLDILSAINKHLIRYYSGEEIEFSLWLCLKDQHSRDRHDRIRPVLQRLLEDAGWKVRFANGGPDERVFISN